MAKSKLTLVDRYWSKVDKSGECWLWKGQIQSMGYGVFTYYRRKKSAVSKSVYKSAQIYAHRLSWIFENGQIPEGDYDICHRCDNPPCVNPAHLFLGTATDNMRDMARKGRASKGGNNAKVTHEQVRLIRADTRKHHIIAADYGMRRLAIWMIKHRRTWADVPD